MKKQLHGSQRKYALLDGLDPDNMDDYKETYEQLKSDPNIEIIHDSISPDDNNRFDLKEDMEFTMDGKKYTISWITGAGEVWLTNSTFMYDYEIAQGIFIEKYGKKKAKKKWKKTYGRWHGENE